MLSQTPTSESHRIHGALNKLARLPRSLAASLFNQDGEFLVVVAMLAAMAVLAINMILPAYSQITEEFSLSSPAKAGLTVSLLYLGLAVGQIILGPISDSIGRIAALKIGLLVFLIGCIVAGLAPSFEIVVLGQIIQGLGLGAPRVITLALLRDRFKGAKMAQAMSFVMVMTIVAPTLAPFIGLAISSAFGWRTLFVAYGLIGIFLVALIHFRLPETLPKSRRYAFRSRSLVSAFATVIRSKHAVGYAFALGIVSGPFIAYLNSSQQVLMFQYELGDAYPTVFAVLSLWLGAASFVNGKLVLTLGIERLVSFALVTIVLVSSVVGFYYLAQGKNPPLMYFIGYMGAVLFCFGLLVSNLNAMAMKSLANAAGTGAAFVGALTTIISIPAAIFIGGFVSSSAIPIAFGFVVSGGLALVVHIVLQRMETVGSLTQ